MPRISNFEILHKTEQPALSIRTKTKIEDLPKIIGESFTCMAAYLEENGEFLSDMPFVAYHNMDMQNLDVEIGFPVSKAIQGKGEIKASCIPEGKFAFCMYLGAYSEMEPTYNEMVKWISEKGFTPVGTAYEHYYNGPEYSENEWLTMIAIPIK